MLSLRCIADHVAMTIERHHTMNACNVKSCFAMGVARWSHASGEASGMRNASSQPIADKPNAALAL